MMYKSLNGIAPVYMSDMFSYVHETHSRDTRTAARSDLFLPSRKHKNIYLHSFAYDGAKIWNDIPINIRNSVSLKSFKQAYLRNYFK
jgi:hypothetical protein